MSAAISPDDRAVGPPERLHPLFLLNGLRRSVRSIGGAYALIGYFAVSGRWTSAIVTAILLLALGIGATILYWMRFEYRVGGDEIRIDSGFFSRRHRSIPFDRVQDVDIVQGPVARLFGLAEVTFETGSGGGKHAADGVLHAIALQRAEQIRSLVRGSRSTPMPAVAALAAEERPPLYSMDLGRLLLTGLFNFSLAVFAGLFGLTQTIGQPLGFDPFRRTFWTTLFAASTPVEQFVLGHQLVAVAAGVALLVLVGFATGLIRTVLTDYGFRLDRVGMGLRRRRGLLTKTDVTLPVRRMQAAVVASGPLRDRFGWSELLVQSLAQEEGSRGNHELAPLARAAEIDAILGEIGWRPVSGPIGWTHISKAYVWAFAIGVSPLLVVAAIAASISTPAGFAFFVLVLVLVGVRALAWRRIGYVVESDRLLMASGWWRRRVVVLPKTCIQSIDLGETFVTRWFGTATLQFGVAGGRAGTHIIPAIPSAAAREVRAELLDSLV